MQFGNSRRRWPLAYGLSARVSTRSVLAICAIGLAALACTDPPPPSHTGLVGGRVLVAPGAGLAGARVVIDQVNLYDGKAELRKHVGETITDDQGFFPALSTGTINGLILIDASGGVYTDPINGARVQLDPSVHLKALHWLGVFEDRSETMYVTPVHALIEARFRYKMTVLGDPLKAMTDAFMHLNTHFGGLDWDKVAPADVGVAAASPTDEVRAAFVLGGLDMLVEDIRTASHSTPQVINLLTWVEAAERDLSDPWLDGNDANASAFGSGLQVGDCPPVDATCAAPPDGCQLGACRPLCDLYANTYRSITADSISRFIGPKASPSPWNRTTLGSEDARAFTDGITRNADPDLFHDACAETQHHSPPIIVWETAPPDGALQGGNLTLRVHAVADDSNKLPTVAFASYQDTDGDPTNDFATATIDTRAATGGVDGPLTVTAIATDLAGNRATSTRTFQIDNTPPAVTLDTSGLYVGGDNVWWAATPRPTLHGTVGDAHPGMVQVVIGGSVVATAEINGSAWSAQLPESALSSKRQRRHGRGDRPGRERGLEGADAAPRYHSAIRCREPKQGVRRNQLDVFLGRPQRTSGCACHSRCAGGLVDRGRLPYNQQTCPLAVCPQARWFARGTGVFRRAQPVVDQRRSVRRRRGDPARVRAVPCAHQRRHEAR